MTTDDGTTKDEEEGPLEVLNRFLAHAFNPDEVEGIVAELVAPKATYVSLNFADEDRHRVMPWAGTKQGRAAFVANFLGVTQQWSLDSFNAHDTMVDGHKVAIFGDFSLRSRSLDKVARSAVAVFAKVEDRLITHFMYMEDTFATARTFRKGGAWTMQTLPGESTFEV